MTRSCIPDGGLYYALRDFLRDPRPTPPDLRAHIAQYDWSVLAPRYDEALTACL